MLGFVWVEKLFVGIKEYLDSKDLLLIIRKPKLKFFSTKQCRSK